MVQFTRPAIKPRGDRPAGGDRKSFRRFTFERGSLGRGEEAAEEWCRGLVANFARKPQGGDRDQIRAVAAGEGDLAVANTYYLAKMIGG